MLPKLTMEPLQVVELTPDEGLPLRILRAYRTNCEVMWSENTDGSESLNPVFRLMNEHNRQRAAILDRAIAKLEAKP